MCPVQPSRVSATASGALEEWEMFRLVFVQVRGPKPEPIARNGMCMPRDSIPGELVWGRLQCVPPAPSAAHQLPPQHIFTLDAAQQEAHVVTSLTLVQQLLEHLHPCVGSNQGGGCGRCGPRRTADPETPVH